MEQPFVTKQAENNQPEEPPKYVINSESLGIKLTFKESFLCIMVGVAISASMDFTNVTSDLLHWTAAILGGIAVVIGISRLHEYHPGCQVTRFQAWLKQIGKDMEE